MELNDILYEKKDGILLRQVTATVWNLFNKTMEETHEPKKDSKPY